MPRGWLLRKIDHCSRCTITTALLPPLACHCHPAGCRTWSCFGVLIHQGLGGFSSQPDPGRHYVGTPGVSECPDDFIAIRRKSSIAAASIIGRPCGELTRSVRIDGRASRHDQPPCLGRGEAPVGQPLSRASSAAQREPREAGRRTSVPSQTPKEEMSEKVKAAAAGDAGRGRAHRWTR
jgi:hypothetical protein